MPGWKRSINSIPEGAVMRRNCAVCYGWTTSAALSQQETDNAFCLLLGHTDLCASERDVCVYRFVFWVYGISFWGCVLESVFLSSCVFESIWLWMHLCIYLSTCLCVSGWVGLRRDEEESWTEAQHILNTSFQAAYVGIECVVWFQSQTLWGSRQI